MRPMKYISLFSGIEAASVGMGAARMGAGRVQRDREVPLRVAGFEVPERSEPGRRFKCGLERLCRIS